MAQLHTYDMVARAFAQERVSTCFALVGDANMAFSARLKEAGCKMIYVRHEHCSVAAAMAYARKTGEVGFASTTCGPGLTQLMTALPAAVEARIPMVIFAGESPVSKGWYNQEIDQAPFVKACGADYISVNWPQRMPTAVRDAFLKARRERRPVVIGLPFDLQDTPWEGPAELPKPSHELAYDDTGMPPNPAAVVQAVQLIEASAKIVVMGGIGAKGAIEACRALAEKLDGLLGTSLPGRGLFCEDAFNLSILGGFASDQARECCAEADLIIAVGCSLAQHNSDSGKMWPKAKVLQIDTHPSAISQGREAADMVVRADAKLGVEALIAAVAPRAPAWRSAKLAEQIATRPADSFTYPPVKGQHDPRDVVAAFDQHLPQDWELVNSSGHSSYFTAQMPGRPQDKFFTLREFGAIGNGVSFAMGVAAARPDKPVVLLDGDGSALMHIQEIETILRYKMKVLYVVFNDAANGAEIHKLRDMGLPDEGAYFDWTNFAAVARGFGANGETLLDLDQLPALIKKFEASDKAMIIDVPIADNVLSPVYRRTLKV